MEGETGKYSLPHFAALLLIHSERASADDAGVCCAAYQSPRSSQRQWDVHDQSHHASKGSGEACDCSTLRSRILRLQTTAAGFYNYRI